MSRAGTEEQWGRCGLSRKGAARERCQRGQWPAAGSFTCQRSAPGGWGLGHIPFPNCQNCRGQRAGCAFAFKNSGIVDISLWLRSGNRGMNRATAAWAGQGRWHRKQQAHGMKSCHQVRARWLSPAARPTWGSLLGLLSPWAGEVADQHSQPTSGADTATQLQARQRTYITGTSDMLRGMLFCHVQMWKQYSLISQNKNKEKWCVCHFLHTMENKNLRR